MIKLSDKKIKIFADGADLNSIKEYCKDDELKEGMNISFIIKKPYYEKNTLLFIGYSSNFFFMFKR